MSAVSIAFTGKSSIQGGKNHFSTIIRFVLFVLLDIVAIFLLFSCSWRNLDVSGSPPNVITTSASSILTHKAILNGTVNPNGSEADAWFEYGTDPFLSTWKATDPQARRSVTTPLPFRAPIRGLDSHKTYYYRVVAANRFGMQRGDIRSFPTGEHYVAVGDSITRAAGGRGYQPTLSDLLENSNGYPNTVTNLGVDGVTSAAGARLISVALSTLPSAKYYLVLYGTNDARLPLPVPSGKGRRPGDTGYAGSYKDNLQKIVSAIRAAGKIPCLAKVPYSTSSSIDIASIRDYNVVVDELVAENDVPVAPPDFYSYFQKYPEELPDGLHPNHLGYESMANLWFQVLTGRKRDSTEVAKSLEYHGGPSQN